MPGQQCLKIPGALGDAVRREAHVLDDHGGTFGAHLPGDAQESLAHPPVQPDQVLVAGELQGVEQVGADDQPAGPVLCGVERGRAVRAELD
jgi:hypothetical protein